MVASTKKGNVPFNDATLATIVLSTCPADWRNQYEMNHKTVPESTRSMLLDLENIKKVFAAKGGQKARSNKTAAGTACIKPFRQPWDAARWEECLDLDEKS